MTLRSLTYAHTYQTHKHVNDAPLLRRKYHEPVLIVRIFSYNLRAINFAVLIYFTPTLKIIPTYTMIV